MPNDMPAHPSDPRSSPRTDASPGPPDVAPERAVRIARGDRWGVRVAWLVIVGLIALVAVRAADQSAARAALRREQGESAAARTVPAHRLNPQLALQAKMALAQPLGMRSPAAGAQLRSAAETPAERVWIVPALVELEGPAAGLAELDKAVPRDVPGPAATQSSATATVEADSATAPPVEAEPPGVELPTGAPPATRPVVPVEPTSSPGSTSAIAHDATALRTVYERSPDTLSPADRDRLVARLGWAGRLALTAGKPDDDPARAAVLAEAERAAWAGLGSSVAGCGALLVGLGLLTWGMVRLGNRQLWLRYEPPVGRDGIEGRRVPDGETGFADEAGRVAFHGRADPPSPGTPGEGWGGGPSTGEAGRQHPRPPREDPLPDPPPGYRGREGVPASPGGSAPAGVPVTPLGAPAFPAAAAAAPTLPPAWSAYRDPMADQPPAVQSPAPPGVPAPAGAPPAPSPPHQPLAYYAPPPPPWAVRVDPPAGPLPAYPQAYPLGQPYALGQPYPPAEPPVPPYRLGALGRDNGRTGPFLEAFALYLLLYMGVALAAYKLLALGRYAAEGRYVAQWVAYLAVPAAVLWPRLRGVSWADWRRGFGLSANGNVFREMGAGVVAYLAGVPVMAVAFLVTFLLTQFGGANPYHPLQDEVAAGRSGWGLAQIYLLAAVAAPVAEELMFRGALFHHLRAGWSWVVSALGMALAFAAVHPQGWAAVPALGAIAVVFAAMREWRGSLVASVTAHALHNAVAVTAALLMLG